MKHAVLIALMLALAACREENASQPQPVTMTEEAVGHYCQMHLLEHPGPKAQVHLTGQPHPLFFSQVRDAIAYQRMPEQSHLIAAIFVNDMAVAPSWQMTGADNWISAAAAFYVVGSDAVGGMEAPELVPFARAADADAFAAERGGQVLQLVDIPDAEVLAPVAVGDEDTDARGAEADFAARLRKLSQERQD
ncbi:nitrous oxide reductase accessory protein NosL [Phaeovulum sp. NW3]|uniref:nitrous oxide reductase accessory protein NosL n=1 Tax=Phaeovulum sp. NW3 TaxID=2934933 RepID=UPI00202180EE|nr:nitrous oxide reductase accessory protein NosL [Phaeovulum sp. NW3]MCL7464686.1 nitrous oxide reductase accessory protein NosL [Phaeovulum sp. NW3]